MMVGTEEDREDDNMDWDSTESDCADEKDPAAAQVACLLNIADLQRVCQKENLNFSSETNDYLLYLTLRKLGPMRAQTLIQKLVDRGEIEWDDEDDFEVEGILDYAKEDDGRELYLIKWKGWSNAHNTWEPKEHLECHDLLVKFHTQYDKYNKGTAQYKVSVKDYCDSITHQEKINDLLTRISRSKDRITPLRLLSQQSPNKHSGKLEGLMMKRMKRAAKKRVADLTNKRTKAYRDLKEQVKAAVKAWEKELNRISTDPAPIFVENKVDLEGPPTSRFTYINDYKEGEGITIPQDPIIGCECADCYEEKKTCCADSAGAHFAYYKNRRVRFPPGTPIYECNKRCTCPPDCPNRVVQHGRKHKLCIFRTHNGRGWGVKAMQRIKKGSFVIEYVGEVITNEEAERRGKMYDAEGMTYLFDLDYNDGDCPFTVDAGFYGNVSHFVNHSCDPNLAVYGVWINTLDPRLPRIALFAQKDIESGEELTFDYMMTGDTTHQALAAQQIAAMQQAAANNPLPPLDNDLAASDVPAEFEATEEDVSEDTKFKAEDISEEEPPLAVPFDEPAKLEETVKEEVHSEFIEPPSSNGSSDVTSEEAMSVGTKTTASDTTVSDMTYDGEVSESNVGEPTPSVNGDSSNVDIPILTDADEHSEAPPLISKVMRIGSPLRPSPAMKYRIRCQCGAKNCRQWLF